MSPSFRVTATQSTAVARSASKSASTPSPIKLQQQDEGQQALFQREWVVTSALKLQTLHIKVPGRVFIDHDKTIRAASDAADVAIAPATTATATDSETDASDAAAADPATAHADQFDSPAAATVAKIVVTSSSRQLLDDLLEVAPLTGDKESAGVHFRVKNQSAVLPQCAVLTQILVAADAAIRELQCAGADIVIGERVLVQQDADAHLSVTSLDTGDVFLSSASGFSLAKLEARKTGKGDFQVEAPSLAASESLSFSCGGERGTMRVAADSVASKSVLVLAGLSHAVEMQTRALSSDMLMIWAVSGGRVTIAGGGAAKHEVAIVAGGDGVINTADILADTASASVLRSGSVVARASDKLHASATWGGRVQFAGERPKELNERSWFRWTRLHGALVTPYEADKDAPAALELKAAPPREPKVVDVRVTSAFFGGEPALETEAAAERAWTRVLVRGGALAAATAAVVAIVVVARRRQ